MKKKNLKRKKRQNKCSRTTNLKSFLVSIVTGIVSNFIYEGLKSLFS